MPDLIFPLTIGTALVVFALAGGIIRLRLVDGRPLYDAAVTVVALLPALVVLVFYLAELGGVSYPVSIGATALVGAATVLFTAAVDAWAVRVENKGKETGEVS